MDCAILISDCVLDRELDPVYPEAKLEVVVQTILRVGCKSISHISVALNRSDKLSLLFGFFTFILANISFILVTY